jgi:hypothetical protein
MADQIIKGKLIVKRSGVPLNQIIADGDQSTLTATSTLLSDFEVPAIKNCPKTRELYNLGIYCQINFKLVQK